MHIHKWSVFVMIGLALLCLGAEKQSQQGGLDTLLPVQDCEGPAQALDVTSERMTFDSQTHTFIFEDNVHIRQCGWVMHCDRLQVANDAKGERIERIVATGNVQFQQGKRHGSAARAEYVDTEQKLVLTGSPRAWDTESHDELTGEEIVVFLQEDKIVVKGARVLFHPRQTSANAP